MAHSARIEGEHLTLVLGGAARTPFRLERLRRAVGEVLTEVTLAEARHVYFTCADRLLSTAGVARLRALLHDPIEEASHEALPGVPATAARFGMISGV